jgi:AraC-like DNA-binding protein
LETGADKYLIKPFNIGILKASIANILTNRALLRSKYAEMELHNDSISINYSNTLDQQFLEAVKETITENLDNSGFNVESLCASQNMSRSSFYNKLKALTDQAPADYIRLIRLKRAAQLLSEGQYNISEISDMTGFNDVKYFREVFKKYYKISPSGYSKGEMKEEPTKT